MAVVFPPSLRLALGARTWPSDTKSGVTSRAAANLPTGAARDMVACAYKSDNILLTALALVCSVAVDRRKGNQYAIACQVGVIV